MAVTDKERGVAEADYFAVFTLPRKLELDAAALEASFYRLSRKFHPDKFANATPQQQQWSLDQSSILNDAYRTLKEPFARTEYLLALEGLKVPGGNETPEGKKQQDVPPDLLEEVFELNMQLEEMRMGGGDDPDVRASLEAAEKNFASQQEASVAELKRLWQQWDQSVDARDTAAGKAVLPRILALLNRRRYVGNLLRDVREALQGASAEATQA